jgi:hypothetical protein
MRSSFLLKYRHSGFRVPLHGPGMTSILPFSAILTYRAPHMDHISLDLGLLEAIDAAARERDQTRSAFLASAARRENRRIKNLVSRGTFCSSGH